MKKLLVIILIATGVLIPALGYTIEEEPSPFQLSVVYPMQLIEEHRSIRGFRFNFIYGINENVTGFDFGLINRLSGKQKGIQFGIINSSFKSSGIQIGLINKTEYLNGIQIGIFNIHNEGNFRFIPGINIGF